jgi:hypothetical protein
MRIFKNTACADWSGAIGERPRGLSVAVMQNDAAPKLLNGEYRWSRADIRDWLFTCADKKTDILIGLDLSFGFPMIDCGAYFPQWDESPPDARSLWATIDTICQDDPHMCAASFLSHPQAHRHFRHSKDDTGDLFGGGIGRLRAVEHHQRTTKQANSWSCFNLVGAGQVGKSSLTGMRMLHQLNHRIPIWPFDPIPDSGPMIVEIYTSMAARAAGMPANRSKIRTLSALIDTLHALDSLSPTALERTDDHAYDALITAAWLHKTAQNSVFWHPSILNNKIAATEGWTFGVI